MSIDGNQLRRESRAKQYTGLVRAIGRADVAPTKHDLALETHRSERQVRRILAELCEAGRVRRVRDADDGRVVRYELAPV